MDSVSDFESGGCGFESRIAYSFARDFFYSQHILLSSLVSFLASRHPATHSPSHCSTLDTRRYSANISAYRLPLRLSFVLSSFHAADSPLTAILPTVLSFSSLFSSVLYCPPASDALGILLLVIHLLSFCFLFCSSETLSLVFQDVKMSSC